MVKKLNLNAIRIDGGTQPRESINMEVVGDYAEAVKVGIEFPPVIVFHDGAEHWLADGFHRWHAHNDAGKASINSDVRQGSLKDAQLYASSREANGTHGLRRTNADKRLCVLMALRVAPSWSDNRVAEHVGVDHKTVAAHRAAILGNSQDAPGVRTVERAGKTYQQDTSNIGKAAPAKAPAPPKAAAAPAAPPAEDFGPDEKEIADAQRAQEEELAALMKLAAADDKLAAAIADAKQLRALNRVLQERNDGLMNEKNELVKRIKALQRKIDKLEKSELPA